jgi:hypothetical protein
VIGSPVAVADDDDDDDDDDVVVIHLSHTVSFFSLPLVC